MSTPIPSPILARMQVMFGAGATVEEVAEALDYELTGKDGEWLVGSAAVDAEHLNSLKVHTASLGKKVDALFQLKKLKDVPEVAGALDLIAHEARAVMREARALEDQPGDPSDGLSEPAVRKSKPGRRKTPSGALSSPPLSAVSNLSQPSRKSKPSANARERASRASSPPVSKARPETSPQASPPPRQVPSPQAPPPLPSGFAAGTDAHVNALSRELNAASPPPLPGAARDREPSNSPSRARTLSAAPQAIPDGVKPSPVDARPAPSSASRPSPGRPSRNALTHQIADVVDQISAISQSDEREEDRPSALRSA